MMMHIKGLIPVIGAFLVSLLLYSAPIAGAKLNDRAAGEQITKSYGPTLAPRVVPPKPVHTMIGANALDGRVIVKLREGLAVKRVAGRLIDEISGDLMAVNRILSQPSVRDIGRVFSRPPKDLRAERLAAQAQSGWELAELNL